MSAIEQIMGDIHAQFSPSGLGGATTNKLNTHKEQWQLLIYINPNSLTIEEVKQAIEQGNDPIDQYLQQNTDKYYFTLMEMSQDYVLSLMTSIQTKWQLSIADLIFYPPPKLSIKALTKKTKVIKNSLLIEAIDFNDEQEYFNGTLFLVKKNQLEIEEYPETLRLSYNNKGVYLQQNNLTIQLIHKNVQNFQINKEDDVYYIEPSTKPFEQRQQIQTKIDKIALTHLILESVYFTDEQWLTVQDQENQTYYYTQINESIKNNEIKYGDFYQTIADDMQLKDIFYRYFKNQQIIENNRIFRFKGLPFGLVQYNNKGQITKITRLGDEPMAHFFDKEQKQGILIGFYVFKLANSGGFFSNLFS